MRTASAAAFRASTAVFSVAAPVEAVHAHQLPEAKRQIEIEVQYAVLRTDERPGDPEEEPAVHSVQTLGKVTVETGKQAIVNGQRTMKDERKTEILYGDILCRIACSA